MNDSTNETGEHELQTTEIDIEEIDSRQSQNEPPPVPPDQKPSAKSNSTSRESATRASIESKLSSIRSHSKSSTLKPPKPPQSARSSKPAAIKLKAQPQTKQAQDDKTLVDSPQVIDARKMIGLCKHELSGQVDDQRAARLHYEIANFYENYLDDNQSASEHYQTALGFQKDHRPSILGARRTLIDARKYQAALPFFDAELPLLSDPSKRARLLLAKGLVLEHDLDQRDQALSVYMEALKLDSTNLSLLRAAGRCQLLIHGWDSLDKTYQRMASVLENEPNYRAAIMAERARLFDVHKRDPAQAAQLYESAISLDPDTPGALEALKRLSHTQGKWLQLISSLEQESTRSLDPEVRAAAQLNIAHLHIEKLGNTDDGIAALENAFRESSTDRTILIKLSALYEENNRTHDLIDCLERLYRLTQDQQTQLSIAHRIGAIYDCDLHDDASAESWQRQALEIDPGYLPAFQALEKLYEKLEKWSELLALHQSELKSGSDPRRCAALHCRIGDLLEARLDDPLRAAQHHAQALEFDPEHGASFKSLTRIYAQAERWNDLVEVYERMIDRSHSPQIAIAYLFRIGALYEDP